MAGIVCQRPCPVCGSLQGDSLMELNFAVFDDETLPGRLDLAACQECGHCFYDGPLTSALVDEHYRRNRYYATSLTPGAGGSSEADRRHQQQIIERVLPWLPPGFDQPIYDVGCGRGGLLRALAESGFRKAMGVELLPEAAALVQAGGFAALEGSAMRLPAAGPAPGLMVYSHVFEHLPAPAEALREARRRLAAGGLVYIEVPDASRYDPSVPWRALYHEHLGHFDPASLERLLLTAGLEILALERGQFFLAQETSEGVVWALARSGNGRAPAGASRPAGEAAAALRRYLHGCQNHPLMENLAALAALGRPLKVWGLSQMTLLLLGSSPLSRADLRGFIDSDPSKRLRTLGGRAVDGPDSLAGSEAELLLAAWGREKEMVKQLKELSFRGQIHSLRPPLRQRPAELAPEPEP